MSAQDHKPSVAARHAEPTGIRPGAYSSLEERIHGLTHGAGFLASLVAVPWLAVLAARHGDGWRLLGGIAFAASAATLFLASMLYHFATSPLAKARLRAFDHSAIYLLIAGSYTPFTISVLRGPWGWGLFAAVWAMAIAGVIVRTTGIIRLRGLSTALYLLMGWMCVVGFGPLSRSLTPAQLHWMIAGGLMYTAGVPFYLSKGRAYMHAIWHLFVLAGVGCHAVAVASLMRA